MAWDRTDANIEKHLAEGSAQVMACSDMIMARVESGLGNSDPVALGGLTALTVALMDLYNAVQYLHVQLNGLHAGLIELAGYEEGNNGTGN